MKKWNNPELLNLMLQETKEVEASQQDAKIFDTQHFCNKDGVMHDNKDNLLEDTCAEGHNEVLNYGNKIFGVKQLDSCCTAVTMS